MERKEKKTLINILENIQFIRGNINSIEDMKEECLEDRCEYINALLNTLSWHIETNLIEKTHPASL